MDWFSVSVMSAVGWAPGLHPVAETLSVMSAALDGAAESPVWSLPYGQVEELLGDAHRLEGRLTELTARLVSEADRRELAKRKGGASTQAWLRHRLQLSPADAKRQIGLAAALCGRLDLTRQALAAGDVSPAHAHVVVKVMDTLPTDLGAKARGCRATTDRLVPRFRSRRGCSIGPAALGDRRSGGGGRPRSQTP